MHVCLDMKQKETVYESIWELNGFRMASPNQDFYLFEKIDHTEFPVLRVGPGPSKIQQGDKMIFVGDKKREEQHAIFYSSPVNCQNSTGNLTFTWDHFEYIYENDNDVFFSYWVYNSARVEVILLEDDGKGGYKMIFDDPSEEKPYVDCGTIQLNTECHAEIPPRDKPFRIGIRAYEISNTDGSFVMIDNILYSASLCKIGIDIGDNFKSYALETGASGKHIDSASQLKCDNFDSKCRWRSGGDAMVMWRRSSSILPNTLLLNATGTTVGPRGGYAVLYVEQGTQKKSLDILRSDPISCQSLTENEFTFRFWEFGQIELEACAVDLMLKDIECIPIPRGSSPANVKVTFRKATKNFMITIRVSSLNSDFDNMVIVDDISYRATLCTDALSVFDIGDSFVSTPMLSLLLGRNIHTAQDLSCDFSKRASFCLWGMLNQDEESSDIASNTWTVGHGPLNEEKLYSLTGISEMPDGEFGLAKFETGGSAVLLSEVVRCALDNVHVQFRLWNTGTAKIKVISPNYPNEKMYELIKICLVEESSPSLLDCQDATSGDVVVDLPRIRRPFRVAFSAEAEDQGMVLIDNIVVTGQICPPTAAKQFASKTFRPTADIPDPNVCRLLSCDFHLGHACLYESSQVSNSAMHGVANRKLNAFLTRSKRVFILESPQFRLNTVARLHFDYKLQGDANLFICNDSGTKELESCFKVEGREGNDYIELLASDTKVYIISRLSDSGKSGSLEISKIVFTDTSDQVIC
uniref:MAM domain-containing protein n=1 Tax=Caenorhabditis tropicalis TaxID=1561998 RepID=A0A1I7TDD8_9PELO